MEKIIVLVGLPAAGKTSIAEFVGKKYSIPLVETSPFVYKSVEERGLPVTPENIKLISTELKSKSDSYYTEKAFEYAKQEYRESPIVFFGGMRAISEIKFLKEALSNDSVIVVAFHASQSTRFNRISNPDRVGGTGAKADEDKRLTNFDYFLRREEKELGFGLGSVFAMADYIINNDDLRFPYSNMKKSILDFENIVRLFMDNDK